MKIRDLISRNPFRKLKSELDNFADVMLGDYLKELRNTDVRPGKKEIFDQVWGPVEFNTGEVMILDSPLIQRLRKIKQLGLASYVYCGADYSRFAHTIGVFKRGEPIPVRDIILEFI